MSKIFVLDKNLLFGFSTGDMIKAIVSSGKKAGTYIGRVAVRASGYFNITTTKTIVQGISYKYCKLLFSSDGYSYSYSNAEGDGV